MIIPASWNLLIKYNKLSKWKCSKQKATLNTAQTASVVPVTPLKGNQLRRPGVFLLMSSAAATAVSLSWGCSVAPPDRRPHQPRQPGARLSFLLLLTSFLQCSEDLESTVDVRNGTQVTMWQKGSMCRSFSLESSSDRLRPSSSKTWDTMASLHMKQKETITKEGNKCVLGYKKDGYEKKSFYQKLWMKLTLNQSKM